jgi:ribosomal protein L4
MQNLQRNVISTIVSEKTNDNSKKPDILRQLFRAFVTNNRTPNKKQKNNNFCVNG